MTCTKCLMSAQRKEVERADVSAQPVTKSEIKLAGHARLMQPSDHSCQNASCRVGGGYFF